MATIENFTDFLEDDSLTLPKIPSTKYPEGKDYVIESPDSVTGARLAAMGDVIIRASAQLDQDQRQINKLKLDDDEERDLMADVLGDTKAEMEADGVKWTTMRGVMKFAFIHYALGADKAEEALRNGVMSGKDLTPTNRAGRRAKPTTRKAPRASTASSQATKPKPKAKKAQG